MQLKNYLHSKQILNNTNNFPEVQICIPKTEFLYNIHKIDNIFKKF